MVLKVDGTNGVLQQYDYQTPTTGFSYTFAAGTTVLVMNPAGTLATGTITMPAAPVDGMTISFSSTQQITTLTVAGNTGQSIVGNPTTMLAGGAATFVYRLSNTTWYTQTNTAGLGTSSGAPVLNVYASPGTWTKPATVNAIKVTVVGGGGAGGLGDTQSGPINYFRATGGGGGGGGTSIKIYPAPSLPGPQPYTVGTAGNTSSFGVAPVTVISATGGSAGTAGACTTSSSTAGQGGAAGVGSSGDLNIGGSGGSGGQASLGPGPGSVVVSPGAGGSSSLGGGGAGKIPVAPGSNYGGGGSGSNQTSTPAGTGAQGVVIVEEFY